MALSPGRVSMRAIVACFGRKMIQIDTQEYSRNSRNPFRLDDLASSLPPMAGRCLPLLEGLAGLSTLADNYDELEPSSDEVDFAGKTLQKLTIGYQLDGEPLASLPAEGATIVVANHPFGGIEGIIMAHLLKGYRDDVRILANGFLKRIPELSDHIITVFAARRRRQSQRVRKQRRT